MAFALLWLVLIVLQESSAEKPDLASANEQELDSLLNRFSPTHADQLQAGKIDTGPSSLRTSPRLSAASTLSSTTRMRRGRESAWAVCTGGGMRAVPPAAAVPG